MKLSSVRAYSVNNLKYARKQSNTATNAISKQNNADNLSLNKSATNTPITYNISFGMARPSLDEIFDNEITPYERGAYNKLNERNGFMSDFLITTSNNEERLALFERMVADPTVPSDFIKKFVTPGTFASRLLQCRSPLQERYINAFICGCRACDAKDAPKNETPKNITLENMLLNSKVVKTADSKDLELILQNLDTEKDKDLISKMAKEVFKKCGTGDDVFERDRVVLEKFKETKPSPDKINEVLGKKGEFWYSIPPSHAVANPEKLNAALGIFGMEPVNLKTEKEKYYAEKYKNEFNTNYDKIMNEKKGDNFRESVRNIWGNPNMTEEAKEQVIAKVSYGDLYDESRGCWDKRLCDIIPAAEIIKYSPDKEAAVDKLLTRQNFMDGAAVFCNYQPHFPLYKVLENEGLEGLRKILDELKDYPKLQYKILTFTNEEENCQSKIIYGINNSNSGAQGVYDCINTLWKDDEIFTNEEANGLLNIYRDAMRKHRIATTKKIADAKAAKNAANS